MNSEAAGYFVNTISSVSEKLGLAQGPPEVRLTITGESRCHEPWPRTNSAVPAPTLLNSDESLIDQISRGAKESLATLFRRHARSVRSVAFRILRNEAEADDLVQDVFLFIFRKAGQFDAKQGSAASWIIRMAYHRALDRRRYLNSRHFYTRLDLDDPGVCLADLRADIPLSEQSVDGILGKELTAKFNARLSAEQRETIRMHFFEGYTLSEISEVTGRSLPNVRSHYYRGLDRLRKFVFRKEPPSR